MSDDDKPCPTGDDLIHGEESGFLKSAAVLNGAALVACFGLTVTRATIDCNDANPDTWARCSVLDVSTDDAGETAYFIPAQALFTGMTLGLFAIQALIFFAMYVLKQPQGNKEMVDIAKNIQEGANGFLMEEYKYLSVFLLIVWIIIWVGLNWRVAVCYLIGGILSGLSGFIGMLIATRSNVRTAFACWHGGLAHGLQVAFRGGAVMGQAVVGMGLFGICFCYLITEDVRALAGYGAGGSSIALFARVAGGIYTKAADVGADLVGKVEAGLEEDDPNNPATIADNVGDNVGDIAGMGADLFESYVGAIVASCILGSAFFGTPGAELPLYIACVGVFCGVIGCIWIKAQEDASLEDLLAAMRFNIMATAFFIVGGVAAVTFVIFEDDVADITPQCNAVNALESDCVKDANAVNLFFAILLGLMCGFLISTVTEYYTSHTFYPTQSIANAGKFGPGPVIIHGLGQGMLSTVVPLLLIVATIIGAYQLNGTYAVALTAVGMLSTLGVTMACDAYGPVADNAGGIAEMTESMPGHVRAITDKLDALGNTTAATGKGFANGSAVLTALSTAVAFTRDGGIDEESVSLLDRYVICGMLLGALLPYVFSSLTMLAVGRAAEDMIREVRRQFRDIPGLREKAPGVKADYVKCVAISTRASLVEMVVPGTLAVLTPLIIGYTFGSAGLLGLLMGAISSGYLLGVMMSNTGGAWDNAKKYVESGALGEGHGKHSDTHAATVAGDTVGDPFKDTSGPSLNILIKIQTRFALVFATAFPLSPSASDYASGDLPKYAIGIILFGVLLIVLAVMYKVFQDMAAKKEDMFADSEKAAASDSTSNALVSGGVPDSAL